MKTSRLSFAVLLPILELALSIVLLAVPATLVYANLSHVSQHGSGVYFHSHYYNFTVPRSKFFRSSILSAANLASRPIQSLNLPGIIGEAIASGATRTWPDSWRPSLFGPSPHGLFMWRSFVFPLYCLPFWWFAGLGLDSLLLRRLLPWPVLLTGSIIFCLFATIGIGLAVTTDTRDYQDMGFALWGIALWLPLMGVYPASWIRSFLRSRKQEATPIALP